MENNQQSLKDSFLLFLEQMNLNINSPLSLRDAITIRDSTLSNVQCTNDLHLIPHLIVQKLMMSDSTCRSCLIQQTTSKEEISKKGGNESDSSSDYEDDNRIHPMDCLLAVLHCCDDFLRYDLVSKMSACQLAIPFLLPNPIDNSVLLLLWAVRSLVKSWKSKKDGEVEHRMVDYNSPIISFLRIGEVQESKSTLLNALIGGESKHDFFFHWDCDGGTCNRQFVNGLVELCLFFPTGKENNADFYSEALTFLNLRGDAQSHPRQVNFIKAVSFLTAVLIDEDELDDEKVKMLRSLAETPGGIVLLTANRIKVKSANSSQMSKTLRHSVPPEKYSRIKLNDKKKNLALVKKDIQSVVSERLDKFDTSTCKCIADSSTLALKASIKIDENSADSKTAYDNANQILDEIKKENVAAKLKQTMLPLQGPDLWHAWATHDKERHRHTDIHKYKMDISSYNSKKDEEKKAVREKQMDFSKKLQPVMEMFIEVLLNSNLRVRYYFLHWLKLFLDDHSRKSLPKLHSEYQGIRDKLLDLKGKSTTTDNQIKSLAKQLKEKNLELIYSSFGLEHLFRELGQIYQARMDKSLDNVPSKLKEKARQFPRIMAEIMTEGYSLELMDGDASHVPLIWVLDVIESLQDICEKLSGDKNGGRIFVLSVLGIQSSGKSTLLNTMFGLRFNVSAGRCTRGAFIQVIPLDAALKQATKCNYILVLDTEGLRAPELQLEGLKHDNELATLVIGLADATIINIFGETPGDLNDILQTSIHAFIRMRQVKMNPSCQFVHQNVPDVLASSKSKLGRQKFQAKLDEMTIAAAEIENCVGQYKSFRDVIHFDDSKAVFYFPTLWKGDPPMAPVNIGYSDSAHYLKGALVEYMKDIDSLITLEVFKLRVETLWTAVLQENFVFNFKNTLEVCAYNELDSQYGQWSWTLQHKMLQWEQIARNKISSCDIQSQDINSLRKNCIRDAENILVKTYNKLCGKMKEFFESSNHSETLLQWEHKMQSRLFDLKKEAMNKATEYCNDLVSHKLVHAEVEDLQKSHVKELQGYIRELVLNSKDEGNELNEADIEATFETKWVEWMETILSKGNVVKYPTDSDIDKEITAVLIELLASDKQSILRKLSERTLRQRGKWVPLMLNPELHLNSTRWFHIPLTVEHYNMASDTVGKYYSKALGSLKDIEKSVEPLNKGLITQILRDLLMSFDKFNSQGKSAYSFKPELKVDVAISTCAYAFTIFRKNINKIKLENDPVIKLEGLKSTFLYTFKSQYQNINDDRAAAESLCNLVINPILKELEGFLESEIIQDMIAHKPFTHSKRAFKAKILSDLANLDSFDAYKIYLSDIKSSQKQWAKSYISNHCKEKVNGKPKVVVLSEKRLSSIIETIRGVAEKCKSTANIQEWLNKFHAQLSGTLFLNKSEMVEIVGVKNVDNFDFFVEVVVQELENVKRKVLAEVSSPSSSFSDVTSWNNPPHLKLYENLMGCTEVCPFCKEQCELVDPIHKSSHAIFLHRPECLGSYIWLKTNKLVLNLCTESVDSNATFQNAATDNKPVPYKSYNTVYPNWYIPTDTKEDPLYWKWFVKKYHTELQNWISSSHTEIPSSWDIPKDVAITNLKRIYKLN